MVTVSIRELRAKTKEVIDLMRREKKVIITSHGKPIAQLVPYVEETKEKVESDSFGMWHDHDEMKDVKKYVRKLRKRRKM